MAQKKFKPDDQLAVGEHREPSQISRTELYFSYVRV